MPRNKKPQRRLKRLVKHPFPNLYAWCEHKPIGIRIIAKMIALAPEDVHWGLEARRSNSIPEDQFVPSDLRCWHRMYYRSARFTKQLVRIMCAGDQVAAARIMLPFRRMKMAARIPLKILIEQWEQMTLAQRQFAYRRVQATWANLEKEVDRILIKLWSPRQLPMTQALEFAKAPEFYFLFRVFGPCLFLFNVPPSRLLKLAALGDLDACDRLLRLDPSAASHPRIAPILHSLKQAGSHHDHARLIRAQAAAPFRPIKLWGGIKANHGSFIIEFAKAMKCRLNAGDIRRYFNAVARDSKGIASDTTLPANDEAFRKHLQLHRRKWAKQLTGIKDSK